VLRRSEGHDSSNSQIDAPGHDDTSEQSPNNTPATEEEGNNRDHNRDGGHENQENQKQIEEGHRTSINFALQSNNSIRKDVWQRKSRPDGGFLPHEPRLELQGNFKTGWMATGFG
jgi:hypothetical protein